MKLEIHFHQMESTDGLKSYIEEGAEKLRRYVDDGELIKFVLGAQGHHQLQAEVFWHDKEQGKDIFSKEQGTDMYALIDAVIEKVNTQLKKHHDKRLERRQKKEPLKKASS